ncbi:hypothetical protein PUNSTDRAFT_131983 [Punctularia strigosozonata HHB-11173 SS5]|uniref:uncharacterized protein n=1 Tax=Punctularia strigosozonata (strain HHB-11173) TaxID=741275 RepID=UPI000441832A|nr:uncharacterized protein PUNSTDRAFT_131983 [Punctularia strigosozonata HHB-11173 SS5]EIN11831.1 hypothetical protein PUNSTDRAFT_131983 [Punctularia strigosozonata HHB-11173 SS5]
MPNIDEPATGSSSSTRTPLAGSSNATRERTLSATPEFPLPAARVRSPIRVRAPSPIPGHGADQVTGIGYRSMHDPVVVDTDGHHIDHFPPPQRHISPVDAALAFFGYGRAGNRDRRELVSMIWNVGFGFVQIVTVITVLAFAAHTESPALPESGISEWHACSRPLGVWNSLWVVRVTLASLLSYWGWHSRRRRPRTDAESGRHTSTATTAYAEVGRRPPAAHHNASSGPERDAPAAPASHLYSRLSLLSTLLGLTWFLTAHILEYTSINTCRITSPHLWWLTFGILAIVYAVILEVFLLGLIIFVFGPVLYLLLALVMLCLGRPLRRPPYARHEIGKLPRAVVDQIPLVLYIPSPPDGQNDDVVKEPEAAHTFPPKPPAASKPKRRFRFRLLRRKKTKGAEGNRGGGDAGGAGDDKDDEHESRWEDNWVRGELPFVRLEENRAACAICLLDFEEPERRHQHHPSPAEPQTPASPSGDKSGVQEIPIERPDLRLEDAGEGAQPLRLLACGHVFHQTCLDPWLLDVSGRCPVCQRPVEVAERPPKKPRRRRGGND